MRDLTTFEQMAAFWVRTGDVGKVRRLVRKHAPVDGRCRECRCVAPCTVFTVGVRVLAEMG